MKNRFFLLFALCTFSAHAEWKQETIAGVQVHYYHPKAAGLKQMLSKRALMVNLHGCSQKAEDLKKDGNWENSADEFNMIVALPKVPNGGVYAGCWDYYGGDHTTSNRHNAPVLNMVKAMLAKAELNIDPNQVYVSGLSSGGGLSMVLGCLAPDVFAGMGLNAAPSTGTSSNEISRPKTSYEQMFKTCKALGAMKAESLKTQLTSIIYGNNDFIVSPTYSAHNSEIMRTLYGANNKMSFDTKALEGTNTDGTGTLWADDAGPRVSLIMNTGLGHNWPAGQGGNSGSFINKKSINYPHYLAQFFTTNNRRSKLITLPEILLDPVVGKESKFVVSGEITIPQQMVRSLDVTVVRKSSKQVVDRFKARLQRGKHFLGFSKELPEGEYDFSVVLNDQMGRARVFKRNSWLGEVEGTSAPQLVNTHYQSVEGCLLLKGQAISGDSAVLRGINVLIDQNSPLFVEVHTDTTWNLKNCQLSEGEHTLVVFAENDSSIRSNTQQITFKVAKNLAVSTLQDHMEAKRLNWSDYGSWYLKYGNSHFSLYLGEDGVWRD